MVGYLPSNWWRSALWHKDLYLKPVNSATVDKRGKLTESIFESLANRTHCKDDMQISFAFIYKEFPHICHCLQHFPFLGTFISCRFHDLCLLITWVHIWNLTVDVTEKFSCYSCKAPRNWKFAVLNFTCIRKDLDSYCRKHIKCRVWSWMTSPEFSRLLMSSTKPSSVIWVSLNKNTLGMQGSAPAFFNINIRSSRHSTLP